MKQYHQIFENMKKSNIGLTGLTDDLFVDYLMDRFETEKKSILVVTPSLYEANQLQKIINYRTNQVYLFPMDDFLTSEAVAISPDFLITRLETLTAITHQEPSIVVTHYMGYTRFLPTPKTYLKSFINLKIDQDISPQDLVQKLTDIGYKRETVVTSTGELGVRGFVLDVFPLGETHPVRIEFFGDTIDSIRYFDEETQKSLEKIDFISISPYTEFLTSTKEVAWDSQKYLSLTNDEICNITSYLDDPIIVLKDHFQLLETEKTTFHEITEYQNNKDTDFHGKYLFSLEELPLKNEVYYFTINNLDSTLKLDEIYQFDAKTITNFNENIDSINEFLNMSLHQKKTVLIYLKSFQIQNFVKFLNCPNILTSEDDIHPQMVNIIASERNHGYLYRDFVILTDKDLFKIQETKHVYKTKFKYASKIKDINKLQIGDYIVHNVHGIGVYNGIKTLTKMGLEKDYLEILYAGKDKLYIPVEKIDLISKYSGNEGMVPKINRLGGSEWAKTKLRVRNKVKDIAKDLLQLYAKRESQSGFAFSKDNELMIQFEQAFEHEETQDQLLAIRQIKEDMESPRPMDRLLCGDVGYGKTEVAFRAAFKAVLDSKQVLYLCPTTILSNQQYENALARFKYFPVNIGLLNRFTKPSDVKKILNDLETGKLDILFGTHRILSDDIKPKDLGLLIIDEEQRFGVVHKEKIKKYKNNVDVLTLTATPIPRTLQMSLVGIRSLSLIETPPVDRYPIQTYVVEENKQIIRDAVYKELSRNGQTFILYNRVENIERKVAEIELLIPDAKVVYAHGQMTKNELENRMMAFINHEYDVLVCTTIIETGIDIPNVNTLIILDADRFGLSQLYQIRGRVGRSNKIAYAYLMYQKGHVLTETAIKRLNVIKEFTELGSGFSIATRDLSIRGAGDILGSEQAGFIDTVGIDLYLRMLNEEVAILKGEKQETESQAEEQERPLIDVATHIDDSYVEDTDLKIEIHRKINEIDSYESLQSVRKEIEDRFGKITDSMEIYMYEEWFEKLAKRLDIIQVRQTRNSIEMIFSNQMTHQIDGEKIFEEAFKVSNMFRFAMKNDCLIIVLDTIKLEKHYIYYLIDLLERVQKCIKVD